MHAGRSGWALVLILGLLCPAAGRAVDRGAPDQAAAVRLAHQYLEGRRQARAESAAQLAAYRGPIDPVLQSLARRTYEPVTAGYRAAEHFAAAELRKRHPDDLLYFVVPKSYTPERPTGLIIFLHGGGKRTPRTAPGATLCFPEPDAAPHGSACGDMLAATGMITVGPSAPWNEQSYHRWCLPEADDYLADVILECKRRFHIDPNRVFLLGNSMGGFGAYQHVQRQPDRFAAVVVNSGSWSLGYWPVIRGTPLCIVQGVHDARPHHRWHYTDVQYARWTDKILTAQHLDHVYLEHDGGHGTGQGREKIAAFLASAGTLSRDPYFPHVALASPVGYGPSFCYPVVHNRWLTLDEAAAGKIRYDELISHSSGDFDSWRLEYRQEQRRGAAIEAVNRGDNTIEVTTQNVARMTVWLHPRMVDVSRPVRIMVDGAVCFHGRVTPSLVTALESYRRRHDWGLIYPIKIELRVPAGLDRVP